MFPKRYILNQTQIKKQMKLVRLNSSYTDLKVVLSLAFLVQRLETVSFLYSVESTKIIPSMEGLRLGRSHRSQNKSS